MPAALVEEAWLRGALPGVPPMLMPIAHALLQVRDDAARVLEGLTTAQIWTKPGGAASVGFHLRHVAGSLDRLLTYARGAQLDDAQRRAVIDEARTTDFEAGAILAELDSAIERAMAQVIATPLATLLDPRAVGRKQLPSTVIGLLFHSAEHATRHAGQALTTARIVAAGLA